MFTEEQIKQLEAPLNRANVKDRKQAGRKVDYIEAWHAIAEANRIFGFGDWGSETDEIRCVAERERQIGDPPKPGWGVTYTCRVRIRVGNIVREGCGAGHGIDQDLGQAHESAIKEAESDARKRALMTFGNPFGLALYDKTKANVQAPPREPDASVQIAVDGINACETQLALKQWWKQNDAAIGAMADADYKTVFDAFEKRRKAVETMDRSAA